MLTSQRSAQRGQSTVELLGLLPALAIITLLAWWVAAAAVGWLQAGATARVAARAASVGESPAEVVRRVPGMRLLPTDPAEVRVSVSPRGLPAVAPLPRMVVTSPVGPS